MDSQLKKIKDQRKNFLQEALGDKLSKIEDLKNLITLEASTLYGRKISYEEINKLIDTSYNNIVNSNKNILSYDLQDLQKIISKNLEAIVSQNHPEVNQNLEYSEEFKNLGGREGFFKSKQLQACLGTLINLSSFQNTDSNSASPTSKAWSSLLGVDIKSAKSILLENDLFQNMTEYFSNDLTGNDPKDPFYCLKIGKDGKRESAKLNLKIDFFRTASTSSTEGKKESEGDQKNKETSPQQNNQNNQPQETTPSTTSNTNTENNNKKSESRSEEVASMLARESLNDLNLYLREAYSYLKYLNLDKLNEKENSDFVAQKIEGYFLTRAEQNTSFVLKVGPSKEWKKNWENTRIQIEEGSEKFSLLLPLCVYTKKVADDYKIAKANMISSLDNKKELKNAKTEVRSQKIDNFLNSKAGKVLSVLGKAAGLEIVKDDSNANVI